MKSKSLAILVLALVFLVTAVIPGYSQGLGFNMDLGLGVSSFPDPQTGGLTTWQNIRLQPDLSFGKFGIGLDVTLNYRFNDGQGNSGFQVREEDWVPSDELGTTIWDLYLPIFRYVRYGVKGDPLFAMIGSIPSATLGNGFILGGYTNSLFMPRRRIVGLSLDFDALLFDFPYFGIETFVSNLAAWDVLGARLYTRPLAWTGIPIIEATQLGGSIVADLNPFYHERLNFLELQTKEPAATNNYEQFFEGSETVVIGGVDIRIPILNNEAINLAAFTDLVFQSGNPGWMAGVGGRIIQVINFGAQVRVLGENFIPVYFDRSYDLFRAQKWDIYKGRVTTPSYAGWFTTLGTYLLDGMFTFNASVEGSFTNPNSVDALNPIFRANLAVAPELLAGFSINANYEKRNLTSFADFISPEDAVIGAAIGYKTGPALINLIYDIRYNPNSLTGDKWESSSRIETTISF